MAKCHRHPEAHSVGVCRACQGEFCEECLVYAFGENRPPYCVDCALAQANRRTHDEIDLREQRSQID